MHLQCDREEAGPQKDDRLAQEELRLLGPVCGAVGDEAGSKVDASTCIDQEEKKKTIPTAAHSNTIPKRLENGMQ